MALLWSWAFGQETAATLNDDMEFSLTSALSGYVPSNAFTYTYAGSPARWSLRMNFGSDLFVPTQVFSPQGWITMAMYNDAASVGNGTQFIQAFGGVSGRSTYITITNAASFTFALYVDNTFKESFSFSINNWRFIALQYDMSGVTWSGRAYVDGVAVTALHTDTQSAEVTGGYHIEGFSANSYLAQIAIYDDLADAGEIPKFVTRISPDTDSSEVGVWTPSAGATNVGVTANDPFDPATYTEDTTPVSGENVVTTFAADIATQLGVSPTTIDGVTTHAYASGTAIDTFASCGAAGAFTDGANFTPDVADTTYGYATAPINPSTVATWVGTDTVQTKFEIV